MIKLVDFSKTYYSGVTGKKNPAVQHVSFKAEPGQITGLLGLNGAGKTTILRAICALHYASSGKIMVGSQQDHLIDPAEDPEQVKALTGYVPEHPWLYNNFTVSEFLKTAAGLRGIYPSVQRSAVEKAVSDFSLEAVFYKKMALLSKGYLQRVSFAQALIHNPPILVLDEPGSGLDPAQLYQIRNFIKKISIHKTVLLSTHNMQEAATLCSNICIIAGGKTAAYGSIDSVIKQQHCCSLESAFLKITKAEVHKQ